MTPERVPIRSGPEEKRARFESFLLDSDVPIQIAPEELFEVLEAISLGFSRFEIEELLDFPGGHLGYRIKVLSRAFRTPTKGKSLEARRQLVKIAKEQNVLPPIDPGPFEPPLLGNREKEVLISVALGLTNQEIANGPEKSISTLQNQLKVLFAKMSCQSRTGLAVQAFLKGLIDKESLVENDIFKKKLAGQIQSPESLSPRQKEILEWITGGFTNKEIAWALRIKEKSVKNLNHKILKKLGVRNRTEAAMVYLLTKMYLSRFLSILNYLHTFKSATEKSERR